MRTAEAAPLLLSLRPPPLLLLLVTPVRRRIRTCLSPPLLQLARPLLLLPRRQLVPNRARLPDRPDLQAVGRAGGPGAGQLSSGGMCAACSAHIPSYPPPARTARPASQARLEEHAAAQ